jgi:hypothetical protein
MTKFNLKEHIAKNKATFFGSLTEGQFSWMTQDTGQQIGSQDENKISVYMFDNKGKYWFERDYDGYGVFGGKDYYDLVAEMNGYTADDAEKFGGTFGELRGIGIKLAFGELEPKNGGPVLFPALVVGPSNFNYRTHDFTKEAEHDPNQSWYEPEEDQDDDFGSDNDDEDYGYNDDEEELDESKVEEAYNTYTFKVAKNFAKYMSKKEDRDFTVTMNSVDEYSFDLDLDGEPYAGGSYLIQNGNIHNVAIPGNPIYATTDDMEDYIGEGYDEFKRADKGSKNVTAKNKGEEEVYGAGVKKGEEIEKKKMKVSEFKAKIKEMILNEMEDEKVVDVNDETPESEEDFLAELEGMLNEAEGLTPLQDYVYQYEIEISGEDEAQEFLDDIRKLKTPQDVYDYYAYDRDWSGSMDDDLENIFRQVKRKFKNLNEASEFDTNKPARIAAFIKDLDALVDEYHAELYLFGDVLDAIEMVKKAANEEMNLNEAEGDKHVVMKGNKFYTGTEFVDDMKDAMKYNLKSATEIAKEKKGMVYTPKKVNENATTDIEAKIKSGEIDAKEIEAAAKKAMSGDSTDLALMMAGFGKMFEAKKDEEVEDEVDIDIESPEPMDAPMGGINVTQNADADLTGTEKELQDNLEAALEAAKKIGDEKLQQQIGNSLTFFTRQHVVKENLKETLLFQKRAGIITETQYKQKLNEISEDEDEVPLTSKVKSFINKAIADSKKDGEFEELKKADWFENELIDELIDLFPNKDYDSASSEVMDYIKDKIK